MLHLIKNTVLIIFLILSTTGYTNTNEWSDLSQQQYVDKLLRCQMDIDALKWSRNIWPKENKKPKPLFSEVVDIAKTRQSVLANLKKQALLADYFNVEITPAMLQNDIDRMARNTKDAKGLIAMFALFDNDPATIAQCISRPYLVNKKIANSFNQHSIIHQDTKQLAEQELLTYLVSRNSDDTTAQVNTVTFKIKHDNKRVVNTGLNESSKETIIELESQEYQQKIIDLKNKKLQQKTYAFIYTEIVEQTDDSIKVKNLIWHKLTINQWLKKQEQKIYTITVTSKDFKLPKITGSGDSFNHKAGAITADTWEANRYFPSDRQLHTAVWTGSEMIIWGGKGGSTLNTGGRYNPSMDSWVSTNTVGAPSPRWLHAAVWSGSEMIIWGGEGNLNTGGRYNPSSDSWLPTSTSGAPSGRILPTAVWSGAEMIIWGGRHGGTLNTGSRYDPSSDSWTSTNTSGAPSSRWLHTAVWSGSEMIVWGGEGNLNTGGRYNPSSDSWASINTVDAPSGRSWHTAVWIGNEMIIWGGTDGSNLNTGSRYNPSSDSWTSTNTTDAPSGRLIHKAIWSGAQMIIWGGTDGSNLNTGGRYNPSSDSWAPTNIIGAPSGRQHHTSVWSGTEMIIWGGTDGSNLNSGGRYEPGSDSWNTTNGGAPSGRSRHTAVWSGNEMIVWGGSDGTNKLNTGSRYNPISDIWLPINTSEAPNKRFEHTAVWSGSEMIIWGGKNSGFLNTGGRYNPSSDSWTSTNTIDAPSGRINHTAVWSGSEMIVWGGSDDLGFLNTGGRYDPSSDSWTSINTSGAPSSRENLTAVWSGSEMIIWGGYNFTYPITGGRYNPSSDSWISTNTSGAPSGRKRLTAVWSGTEMIVWGGDSSVFLNTGGRYNPSSDSWASTNTSGAPSERWFHTAVWSGSEMIIWGGKNSGFLNTGGRYDPILNSWQLTNTNEAPDSRWMHTAVWTGSEMIIWGGFNDIDKYVNSMGIYYPTSSYTISGTLTGLNGSQVILQNNGSDDLTLSANGGFAFDSAIVQGDSYAVTVLTNPSGPAQTCTVTNGSGASISATVTNVAVNCVNNSFNVGVTVSGLAALNSVEFFNNGGNSLNISADGSYNFSAQVLNGGGYNVTVNTPPTTPSQICTITAPMGVVSSADVNLTVTCVIEKFDIWVSAIGLATGNSIEVTNGAVTKILSDVITQTSFNLDDETVYSVSNTNATTPNQVCSLTGGTNNDGSGILAGTDVAINITCITTKYDVNVTVTGLAAGNSIDVSNGAVTETLTDINPQTAFNLDDGTAYAVSTTNPTTPSQVCSVTGGSNNDGTGDMTGSNVIITITCVIVKYDVNVTVIGLASGNSIEVTNGGVTESLSDIITQTSFNLDDETVYSVSNTNATTPNQVCSLTGGTNNDGSGILAGTDVAITIICTTNQYFIGGVTTGLFNANPVTLSQGAENLVVDGSTFIFLNPLTDASDYNITIAIEPISPSQSCNLSNNTGQIAGADIIDVQVACQTNSFSIGGMLSGMHGGNSITLQNNNTDDLLLSSNGTFTFTSQILDLQAYAVSITTQPTAPIQNCTVTNGANSVVGEPVTTITVACDFGDDLIFTDGFGFIDWFYSYKK